MKSFDSSGISKSKIKSLKIPAERDIKKVLKNVTSTPPVCYFSGIAQYYFSKHIATGLATLTYFLKFNNKKSIGEVYLTRHQVPLIYNATVVRGK